MTKKIFMPKKFFLLKIFLSWQKRKFYEKKIFYGKKILWQKLFFMTKNLFMTKQFLWQFFFISGTLLFPSSTAKSGFPFFTKTKSTFGIIPKKVELLIRFFEPFWISRVFHFSLRTFGKVEGHPEPLGASDETHTHIQLILIHAGR